MATLPEQSYNKLDFNELPPHERLALLQGMRQSFLVEQYFERQRNILEQDQIADGFHRYYRGLRQRELDAGEIIWELNGYIYGTVRPRQATQYAADIILAHFFERCHIFENPPPDWIQPTDGWRLKCCCQLEVFRLSELS
ncbi:MAG TPA: hypothetical protein H9881_18290 [Candidatus Stackebrandtia excrementipullorum]|nr:hypothetical protein [Candidatus Stackebrandtia excrementipullorum]